MDPRFTIKAVGLAGSVNYHRHYLGPAGRTDLLFADHPVARLQRVSNWLPRQLNNSPTAADIARADDKDLVDDTCDRPSRRRTQPELSNPTPLVPEGLFGKWSSTTNAR